MAAETGDGGGDSKALGGDAGYGYFCWIFAAPGAVEGREEAEMDSLDGSGRGAINVSGAAGIGNHGHEPQRNFFRADGRAHHGFASFAGAKFSRLSARTRPRAMVAAGDLGQAPAFDGAE